MSEWSRRDVLRVSSTAAVAVPIAALVASPADAAADAPTDAPTEAELDSFSSSPVMFVINDARRGEVAILHGEHEVVVHDRALVARIIKAAQHAQKVG